MSRKKLAIIDLNKLDGLTTKRLLARLKRLHQCEESKDRSDRDANYKSAAGVIEFKDSPEWKAEYNYLKKLLSAREHISNSPTTPALAQIHSPDRVPLSRL